ncbi:MAG: ribonuclease HIII [Verrucomicrobiota bacterium]|nr:ribonuclease HIII [Verrucomicrobiota bacterium]
MSSPKPITSYTTPIAPDQAKVLKEILKNKEFAFKDVPYAVFSAGKNKLNVTVFESGKCLVQGKGTEEFVQFILEPEVLKEAKIGYEFELNPDQLLTRVGVDESGKGDFFGPLVTAAVYVNEEIVYQLKDLGVKDSKRITSDKKIADISKEIRHIHGLVYDVISIGPAKYSAMWQRMGSVNEILGWAHATALENVLKKTEQCPLAISDKFSVSEWTVKKFLGDKGKQIKLIQRTKAESDYAVAAASILARDGFVQGLYALGNKMGVILPKGASAQVKEVARGIATKSGVGALHEICKTHFKTFEEVKSLI